MASGWNTFGTQLAQSGLHAILPNMFPASLQSDQSSSGNGYRGFLGVRNLGMAQNQPNQMMASMDDDAAPNPALGNVAPLFKRTGY